MHKLYFNCQKKKIAGFTLIELSIVLVIIGLLAGGVLVGRDLIHAAEMRSITKDIEQYKTAVYTFKSKYDCIPGDCLNATSFWGTASDCATAQNTAATCNGYGNMLVDNTTLSGTIGNELLLFWKHLANAGLIAGRYNGIPCPGGAQHHIIGTNAPGSTIPEAGFLFWHWDYSGGGGASTATYAINYGNSFMFGKQTTNDKPQLPLFTPMQAMTLDSKVDDGLPATGSMIARTTFSLGTPSACSTSANNTDFTGIYNLTHSLITCHFIIKSGI